MSVDWWLYQEPDGSDGEGALAEYNLTYNLNRMLWEAGWRWGEGGPPQTSFPNSSVWPRGILSGMIASELGEKLGFIVTTLREDPEGFRAFNPPNGWGNYEGCLEEMERFLRDIERWPNAKVGIST